MQEIQKKTGIVHSSGALQKQIMLAKNTNRISEIINPGNNRSKGYKLISTV